MKHTAVFVVICGAVCGALGLGGCSPVKHAAVGPRMSVALPTSTRDAWARQTAYVGSRAELLPPELAEAVDRGLPPGGPLEPGQVWGATSVVFDPIPAGVRVRQNFLLWWQPEDEAEADANTAREPATPAKPATEVVELNAEQAELVDTSSPKRAVPRGSGDLYFWFDPSEPPSLPAGRVVTDGDSAYEFDGEYKDTLQSVVPALETATVNTSYRVSGTSLLPNEETPDAIAVLLPGLGGYESMQKLHAILLDHQYAVAVLTSLQRPNLGGGTIEDEIGGAEDIDDLLHRVDRVSSDVSTAMALTAEVAVKEIDELLGGEPRPVVIVGYSLGALATPAAAWRLRDRIAAAVLVGGGADMASIAFKSKLMRPLIRDSGALDRVSLAEVRARAEQTRELRPLDPYFTAAALTGVPVLQIHAKGDRIVPAESGELLWERLGRPERWDYPGGHITLFWSASNFQGDIVKWLDDQLDRSPDVFDRSR